MDAETIHAVMCKMIGNVCVPLALKQEVIELERIGLIRFDRQSGHYTITRKGLPLYRKRPFDRRYYS
jgi:hypothetical protein